MPDEKVWTVAEALAWTREFLQSKDDPSPRLSAEWLLSASSGLSRLELYTQGSRPLSQEERATLREAVRRRAAGEPLQYVTGEMPFRHLVVRVEPGVLIPRPETEVLVDEGLRAISGLPAPLVLDVCAGSGCVGLSIAQEMPVAEVWACDLSSLACECTEANAERLRLDERVHVAEGDLFSALPAQLRGSFDLVIANPPYVPSGELPALPAEVGAYEPALALDGGTDGLEVARRIWRGAREWMKPGATLALELDERKVRAAAEEIVEWYEQVRVVPDLTGRDRILVASASSAGPGSTVEGGNGDV
jgi:release factor-specific protein-(glutamine-N5) methyltransferase